MTEELIGWLYHSQDYHSDYVISQIERVLPKCNPNDEKFQQAIKQLIVGSMSKYSGDVVVARYYLYLEALFENGLDPYMIFTVGEETVSIYQWAFRIGNYRVMDLISSLPNFKVNDDTYNRITSELEVNHPESESIIERVDRKRPNDSDIENSQKRVHYGLDE